MNSESKDNINDKNNILLRNIIHDIKNMKKINNIQLDNINDMSHSEKFKIILALIDVNESLKILLDNI